MVSRLLRTSVANGKRSAAEAPRTVVHGWFCYVPRYFLGLLLWDSLFSVDAKRLAGTVKLGGGAAPAAMPWQYLGKFGFDLGEGEYSLRLRARSPVREPSVNRFGQHRGRSFPTILDLDVFLDEDWHRVEALSPCRRALDGPARRTLAVEVGARGGSSEWGAEEGGIVLQVMRPHIWYFALSDCKGELGNQTVDVDFELHATQEGGSELSVEARYMPAAEIMAVLGLTVLIYYVAKQCARHLQSSGALHPVIWALAAAVVLQFVSHASQLVHLLSYRSDGVGLWKVDAFAEVLFMASQMVHATLFIAIARGYTLVPAKDCQLEFTRLSFAASLAAHAALVCFGKLQEGTSSHRHHDNDGPEGLAIILIRCLLFGCFISALRETETRSGYCVQELLRRIRCAGSLYFLSYPIVFLSAQIFAAYLRHPVMEVGLFIAQASADVWLAKLFLDRNPYWKASCLGASLLPGGTCFGGSTIFGLQRCD